MGEEIFIYLIGLFGVYLLFIIIIILLLRELLKSKVEKFSRSCLAIPYLD